MNFAWLSHLSFSTKSFPPDGEVSPRFLASLSCCDKNSLTKSSLGKEGFIWLTFPGHVTEESPDRNSNRNLKQKPWWNTACWLVHRLARSHFSSTNHDPLPSDDTAHGRLDPSTPTKSQDSSSQTDPQAGPSGDYV